MNKIKDSYDRYSEKIEHAMNRINLKQAVRTERKGKGKLRDLIVLGKYIWTEAQSYISPLQSMVVFAALMVPAVITINSAIRVIAASLNIRDPFQFPVESTAIFVFIFIIGVFIFGYISVRMLGTTKRSSEIGNKLNPAFFCFDEQIVDIKEEQKKIKKLLNTLIKLVRENA
jgi:hypothetical protein